MLLSSPFVWLLSLAALLTLLLMGRLLWGRRGAPGDVFQACLIYILLGLACFSWSGVWLAMLGLFYPWAMGALLAVAVVLRWVTGSRPTEARPVLPLSRWRRLVPWIEAAALLGLLVAAAWLYGRPSETFRVTHDASIYTLSGIALARTGSLWLPASALGPWNHDVGRLFYSQNISGLVTRYFGSFYPWGGGGKTIEIGFLPLAKVWAGYAALILGSEGAIWASPLAGLLSLLGIWGLGRQTLGRTSGWLAAALWAVSLPAIWYARQSLSETWALTLALGSLALAAQARSLDHMPVRRDLLILSSFCLGGVTLARFEAPLMVLPAIGLLVWLWRGKEEQSITRFWLLAACAASLLGLLMSLVTSRFYYFDLFLGTFTPQGMRLILVGISLAVGGLGAGFWLHHQGRLSLGRLQRLFARVAARPGTMLLGLWALWSLVAVTLLALRPWGETVPGWLAQYAGLASLLLGLVGGLLVLRRELVPSELAALWGVAVLFLLMYSLNPLIVPLHPWAVRRLVPLVFPALALALAAVPLWVARQPIPLRREAAIALGLALVVLSARPGQFLWQHDERRGEWAGLQAVHQAMPADALVLVEQSDLGQGLPQPLLYAFGHPTLTLASWEDGRPRTDPTLLLEAAREAGRPVYLLVSEGVLRWSEEGWRLHYETTITMQLPVLQQPEGRPPDARDLIVQTIPLDLYRLVPVDAPGAAALQAPASISMGPGSYPYVRQGLYTYEPVGDGTYFRWTDGDALLSLPRPTGGSANLTLTVAGGRLGNAPSAELTVELDGRPVWHGTLPATFEFQTLSIPIEELDEASSADVTLRLRSTTFSAGEEGNSRALGVMLAAVSLQEAQ